MEAVEREEEPLGLVLAMHEVLPLEVMQHIMGLADPASVARAEGVCRAWRSACESPFVWEAVFRRHFSSRPSPAKGTPLPPPSLASVDHSGKRN
jgi:hypothetical protein